ncbi:tyrosine-type recombinase/integrase [Vibrio barjaei]|uniref:tyrosine-type recombinase/integrase n=1 Tax=Vibrio barjaei TaxID=1676683 RepID=UPI00228370EF|nr:tyrosine-type recombinase/integrase [Vibrio barjaei]MCY9872380.1 tyrosine-type recombinase/integrase [Vibrio barjaei]
MLPVKSTTNLSQSTIEALEKRLTPYFADRKKYKRFNIELEDLSQEIDLSHPLAEKAIENLKMFDLSRDSLRANSIIALNSVIRSWVSFNRMFNEKSLPCDPLMTIAYYMHLDSEGKKLNTIKQHQAQISKIHKVAGLPNPNDHAEVMSFIRTLQDTMAETDDPRAIPDQAYPLRHTDLKALSAIYSKSDKVDDIRDMAVLSLAYATMLREEEVCELRIKRMELLDDGGIKITRNISKTENTDLRPKYINASFAAPIMKYFNLRTNNDLDRLNAIGDEFFVVGLTPRSTSLRNPSTAITPKTFNKIFERAYGLLHPEFVELKQNLSKQSVKDSVNKKELGNTYPYWTGHSARVGCIVDAYEKRVELNLTDKDLMDMGDWRDMQMVNKYIRRFSKVANGPSATLQDHLEF